MLQAAALVLPHGQAPLVTGGLVFGEDERQRGPAAGCFCLPSWVVPPFCQGFSFSEGRLVFSCLPHQS